MGKGNRNGSIILMALFVSFFSSCVRKELPVPQHEPGDVITSSASMGADYRWQLYYNLKDNKVVGKNLKDTWNLGFEATANGYHVILNSGLSMFAYPTGKSDMASVTISDTAGRKKWDAPNGCLDSTAIGEWKGTNMVYIIDKGYNVDLVHQGYKKLQFLSVSDRTYSLKCADMNGGNEQTIEITKDSAYNFVFLSLKTTPEVLIVEPPKADWDLVFTQYTHVFTDLNETYLVTGCLLNRYSTAAYMDSFVTYEEINFDKAKAYTLSPFINTIGYDWKTVGSTTGGGADYKVHFNMNYIIRTSEKLYYKLRFIDFYDNKVKGNPKWEYQEL